MSEGDPAALELRDFDRARDRDAVQRVFGAMDLAEVGTRTLGEHEIDVRLARADRAWVALAHGQLVGFASLTHLYRPEWMRAELACFPAGQGATEALLDSLDAQARAMGARSVRLWQGADGLAAPALRERRWQTVRVYVGLRLALATRPAGTPAASVEVREATDERAQRLAHELIEQALGEHWEHHPRSFEEFAGSEVSLAAPTLWYLAYLDRQPAGALVLEAFEECALIAWLGVRERARGRGVAGVLLESGFRELERRRIPRAEVVVDSENAFRANLLYERAGMRRAWSAQQWQLNL